MSDTPDWTLIDRWLAGEADADETRVLDAWSAGDPQRRAWLDALRQEHDASADSEWDVDAAWSALRARGVGSAHAPAGDTARRDAHRPIRAITARAPWRLAAALLLVAGLGTAALWPVLGRDRSGITQTALRELRTTNGTRATLTLDDGSRVVLNAGSVLRYPERFAAGARDVWLEGEGYFEVEHDPSHPFRVHALGAVAEDLGTRFVVRAYAELGQVDVMVDEGLVSLRRDGTATGSDSALLLRPGRHGRLRQGAAPVEADAGDESRWLGWTRGDLVLDAPTLREAIPIVERWYDVRITVPDSLGRRAVRATFRDATLPQVLDALALSLGARWTRDDRTITFVMDR